MMGALSLTSKPLALNHSSTNKDHSGSFFKVAKPVPQTPEIQPV